MSKRKRNTDPRDIPYHVNAIDWRYNDPPEDNGDNVRYGGWESGEQSGDGAQWYEVGHATGSDYSGGLVTKANYESLQEMLDEEHPSGKSPAAWGTTYGGHGTYGILVVWDRLDSEIQDVIGGLEDYPLIDDDKHSELQMEAEGEAWENWAQREFEDALEKHYDLDEFPDGVDTYEIFHQASEKANEYWEDTSEGVYISIDRVVPSAIEIIDTDSDLSKKFSERAANPNRPRKATRALKAKLLR